MAQLSRGKQQKAWRMYQPLIIRVNLIHTISTKCKRNQSTILHQATRPWHPLPHTPWHFLIYAEKYISVRLQLYIFEKFILHS